MDATDQRGRPRIGVAISGGGCRAACWGAGALMGLADAGVAGDVVSMSSVSGGSYTNAAVMEAGDFQDANRTTLESWFRRPLRQWAHDGLFFPGPLTDRWLGVTLAWLVVAVAALVAAFAAMIAAFRDLSLTEMLIASGIVAVVVTALFLMMARKLMPSRFLRSAMWMPALLTFPLTLGAIALVSWNGWFVIAVIAIALVKFVVALKRFGRRSAEVERALTVTFPGTLHDRHDIGVHHVFCTADLNTGNNLYLTNRMVWGSPDVHAKPGQVTVGLATQASSCLPGAFLARHFAALQTDPPSAARFTLSDGGVYDNMADQWEWGYENRKDQTDKLGCPELLIDAQPKPADVLVVVNASRGMQGRGDVRTDPGLRGELKSALSAKDVIYDVSTATRRRLLIDLFDRADSGDDMLDGMLVHIGTDPYSVAFRFFDDPGPRGDRSRAALKRLDEITDQLAPPPQGATESTAEANARRRDLWKAVADRNAGVATTLAPLESLDAGSTASLLHHAWVLTRIGGWVMHDWRGATPDDLADWQLARFVAIVDDSRNAVAY